MSKGYSDKMNTIKFIVAVSIVLLSVDLFTHLAINASGLNTSNSMVDKLIKDYKTNNAYRTELINKIKNSQCYSLMPER
jgi:hypothetical protein